MKTNPCYDSIDAQARGHSVSLNFRLNPVLFSSAEATAKAKGVSLSEFVRDAVGKEVDACRVIASNPAKADAVLDNPSANISGSGESFDPNLVMGDFSLVIRAAASGDLRAQRQGCEIALHDLMEALSRGDRVMAQGHALELMFWCRFAASHNEDQDAIALIAALLHLADFWAGDNQWGWYGEALMVEATSLADRLATKGNEQAATALNMIADKVGPHIFLQAKEIA